MATGRSPLYDMRCGKIAMKVLDEFDEVYRNVDCKWEGIDCTCKNT